jgi:hypothetical protein
VRQLLVLLVMVRVLFLMPGTAATAGVRRQGVPEPGADACIGAGTGLHRGACACGCACVRESVLACVALCVRVCVCACVRACVRTCVHGCMHVFVSVGLCVACVACVCVLRVSGQRGGKRGE